MKRFRVGYDAGFMGTDISVIVEAENEVEAIDMCLDEAWDWFWNFNDEEDFKDYEADLDIWAVEISEDEDE